jgi:exopolysaccharide production protein ExoZ
MASRSLNTLQAGRALASLAVLLLHANAILELPKYLDHKMFAFFKSGAAGVQFFFVLSGFVIFLAHKKDIGHPATLREFLWKRFRRVYSPLWIVLFAVIPMFFLVPSFGTGGERNISTIVSAFLICPAPPDLLLSTEWTLRHEVLFYLVFGLLIWNRSIGTAVAALWLIPSAILPWFNLNFPWDFLFTINHLLFFFGIFACLIFKTAKVSQSWAVITAITGLAIFSICWFSQYHNMLTNMNLLALIYGLGATLLILGLAVVEQGGALKVPAILVFVGEASYSIYLTHYPVISLVTKVLLAHNRHRFPDVVLFLIIAFVAVAVGILFYLAIEKPLMVRLARIKMSPVPSHG